MTHRLLLGQAVLGLAEGLVAASWFLWLDQVRGFGAVAAGWSFTLRALGMIVTAPLAGWLVDRRGPRVVVLAGTLGTVTGAAALGLSPWAAPALAGSLLYGTGTALTMPATRATLVRAVSAERQSQVSSASFTLWNLGIGSGSLLGGLAADPASPPSFTALFLAAGLLGVAVRLINLPAMPRRSDGHRGPPVGGDRGRPLRSPGFTCYLVLAATLALGGYGQTASGVPGLATTLLGLSPATVGAALAANTTVILACSPLAVRFARRVRRSSALGLTALVWSAAWATVAVGVLSGRPSGTVVGIVGFYVVFGAGQTLLAAVAVPLVVALAPPGRLGACLGLDTFTRQIGMAAGPLLSGALIAQHAVTAYLGVALAVCLAGAGLSRVLRRLLTSGEDRPALASSGG